jgi:alkanesulfonate monooxygenase SsuD/methylene tetrahydromethanopterin reductase-like flavin-dependent oxidoreductase (luciferase family)
MVSNGVRFSVLVLPNVPWREFLRRCQWVEELGFDSIGLADHLVDWAGGKGPWFELWTQLSAIAQATTRIRLATLVAQIPLRNPVLFALQALTADHISGGRLDVGLGTGLEIDPSYRMMGIDNWTAKERVARFAEYVDIVSHLLSQEETSYQGRFYGVGSAALLPRPVQSPRPPLIIAAMGPVMLGHAARYADIWNSLSFARSFEGQIEETRMRVASIDAHCGAIGRDPSSLRRSYLMFDPTARSSGGMINYYESEATFTDMVHQVLALGLSEVVLYYPALDTQLPMFEQIARSAVPALKAAYAARIQGSEGLGIDGTQPTTGSTDVRSK